METFSKSDVQQLHRLLTFVTNSLLYHQQASEKIKFPEFRDLLKQYVFERERIATDLKNKITDLNGDLYDDEEGVLSVLERGWIGIKLNNSTDKELLESCKLADLELLQGYDKILNENKLSNQDITNFLKKQQLSVYESFWELDSYFNLMNDNTIDI